MKRSNTCLGMTFGVALLIPLAMGCSRKPAQAPVDSTTTPTTETGTPSTPQPGMGTPPNMGPAQGPTGQLGTERQPDQSAQGQFGQDPYGQRQPGQDQVGQRQPGQDRFGQRETGQDKFGQRQPGQDKYGQRETGQDKYGQRQPGQGQTGQQPGQQGLGSGIGEQPPGEAGQAVTGERALCESLASGSRMRVEDAQNGVAIVITPRGGTALSSVRDDARRLDSAIRAGSGGVRSGETCGLAELGRLPSVSVQLNESDSAVRIVMTTTNAGEVKDLRRIAREEVNNLNKSQGKQQQRRQPGEGQQRMQPQPQPPPQQPQR